MKKINSIQFTLFLFGVIAVGIGFSVLFFPVQFEASADIVLEKDASLLSELRAFGGLIFVGGIVILLGVFKQSLILLSVGTSTILYLTIAFSRLVGMVLDNMPSHTIVSATIAEIVIGVISMIILLKVNSSKKVG
ncbi:protein of unknown function [Reichenbachiella agariperforans]|uniref:DUF4345 domain-containing protein n=1 Tax=Reichenbachiella agariperforans TaxID=156994 RepID=A0A1M6SZC2_REIAG|nr:DUF4345 domain-containing protein [Reichenbachiella agariperforans]SHK50061.1 protein of unknown function [Reichenbachiella agariperforans]